VTALEWVLREERSAYEGLIRILRRKFVLGNGHECEWDVLAPAEMVSVVAVTHEGEFLMVRQFRAGPMRILDELPGGYVDVGETIVDAAARELHEETGYAAESVGELGSSWAAPDAALRVHAVLALGCKRQGEPHGEEEESGHVLRWSAEDFVRHVREGQFTDQGAAYRALDALGLL
jgi:ADP-ribose pyrophosphatase